MRKATVRYLENVLIIEIVKDGYLLRLTYDRYVEICNNNNIPVLPSFSNNFYQYYYVSPETWEPSYVLDTQNLYLPISTLNITADLITQLFNNLDLLARQSNVLQDPIYYPFGSAPAVNPKVSVTIEPPTTESSTTFFNQPVMRWNPWWRNK